jgi:hypothetical protein
MMHLLVRLDRGVNRVWIINNGGGECACFTQSGTATKIQKRGQSDRTYVCPLLE